VLEAGAADHHVEPVLADIVQIPCHSHSTVRCCDSAQHAGPSELEEAQARMTLDETGDIELVWCRNAVAFRHVLAQQAIRCRPPAAFPRSTVWRRDRSP